MREHLVEVARETCDRFEAVLVEADGEPDHLHLLIDYPPKVQLSKLIGSIKTNTSREIRAKNHPEVKQVLRATTSGPLLHGPLNRRRHQRNNPRLHPHPTRTKQESRTPQNPLTTPSRKGPGGQNTVKFWFSVSRHEQLTRFTIRQIDPVRQWKLSRTDLVSLDKWDAYTEAKEETFRSTDTPWAPWTVVKSNDKKRARLGAMRHVLSLFDYDGKDHGLVGVPDQHIVGPASAVVGEGEEF